MLTKYLEHKTLKTNFSAKTSIKMDRGKDVRGDKMVIRNPIYRGKQTGEAVLLTLYGPNSFFRRFSGHKLR